MQTDWIDEIRAALIARADAKTGESAASFFKEPVHAHGVKTGIVSQIAREYYQKVRCSGKDAVFSLCESLFQSGWLEESFIACDWAYRQRASFRPSDFARLEGWVERYVSNWATCDTLCNHAVGDLLELYPECLPGLKGWALSANRWLRRAAAVSLIIPARKGLFLPDILEIADLLLNDQDDLVQKGCGWMLKEASRPHLETIFAYVIRNRAVMPRTTLRYAIEKMPPDLRREAMVKPARIPGAAYARNKPAPHPASPE